VTKDEAVYSFKTIQTIENFLEWEMKVVKEKINKIDLGSRSDDVHDKLGFIYSESLRLKMRYKQLFDEILKELPSE
jgi:hypothetical protein